MAAIIRARRLDVRILLDAHDRKNCGYVDMETFRRALCYAFGNNWTELAMTSAEFDEITKPYLTRTPNRPSEPCGFVFFKKFAFDLQTLADRKTHSDAFMSRLTKIEAKERVARRIEEEYGVTEYELKSTFLALKERITHGGSNAQGMLTAAFRRMDPTTAARCASRRSRSSSSSRSAAWRTSRRRCSSASSTWPTRTATATSTTPSWRR